MLQLKVGVDSEIFKNLAVFAYNILKYWLDFLDIYMIHMMSCICGEL